MLVDAGTVEWAVPSVSYTHIHTQPEHRVHY